MRKIGLFGGSFDPIHAAHIKIAKEALTLKNLDEVIFIPSGESPHKDSLSASASDRYNMVKIAIDGEEKFSVSDYEIKKEGKSYTYYTLCHFKEIYPDDELFFIIGDDEYDYFPNWYKADELHSLCTFLVFQRHGRKILPPFSSVDTDILEISSTEIRERIISGRDASDILPDGVTEYILEKGLYR